MREMEDVVEAVAVRVVRIVLQRVAGHDAIDRQNDPCLAACSRFLPDFRRKLAGQLLGRGRVVVEDGRLAGVIDWVDVCRDDPGIDLSLVWSFLPLQARADFLDEYGPVSEESLLRARVLAVFLNAVLALYGQHESLPAVEREALAGLRRAANP